MSRPRGRATADVEPQPRPSPRWYGGAVLVILVLAFVWLLAYTWLDPPWLARLGGWNYLVFAALLPIAATLARNLRTCPEDFPRTPDPGSAARNPADATLTPTDPH